MKREREPNRSSTTVQLLLPWIIVHRWGCSSLPGEPLAEQISPWNFNDGSQGLKLVSFVVCCSDDGSVKIWDDHKTLVSEFLLDDSLCSACFLNGAGDVLIGFKNHIFFLDRRKGVFASLVLWCVCVCHRCFCCFLFPHDFMCFALLVLPTGWTEEDMDDDEISHAGGVSFRVLSPFVKLKYHSWQKELQIGESKFCLDCCRLRSVRGPFCAV